MEAEERILNIILERLTALQVSQEHHQDDVRRELADIRKEMHARDRQLDKLKSQMVFFASAAAIIATGVVQWVTSVFF